MRIPLLDHGYVQFIEPWGTGLGGAAALDPMPSPERGTLEYALSCNTACFKDDNEVGIIEAARQSTQGAFRGWTEGECNCSAVGLMKSLPPEARKSIQHDPDCTWHPGDEKLLKHLFNNNHATPFEFAGMVIEVQAPIFVFREWHRHRTQSYNEMSARYSPLPDLYYTPDAKNVAERIVEAQVTKNKQLQAAGKPQHVGPLDAGELAKFWVEYSIKHAYDTAEHMYQDALKSGIPKELARLVMPVGHYSRMRATANLRNWLSFMTLRCDPNAQWEIRQYANAVGALIRQHFPRTHSLWSDKFVHG